MTPYEFELALTRSKMPKDSRTAKAVRLVLVNGHTLESAAKMAGGISKQAVSKGVKRLERQFKRERGVPMDWACVTVCVPVNTARRVKNLERKARIDANLEPITFHRPTSEEDGKDSRGL